jgi:hypothetical protein
MQKDEILPSELPRHATELKAAVEAVCQSQPFRTSAKSCQFLRHIVRQTLDGNVDELKERLIGIALLGREASYDTGSDAGVRVRANDVRKRLAAYYAAGFSDAEFTLEIAAGSYIPRFYLPRNFHAEGAEPAQASVSVASCDTGPVPFSELLPVADFSHTQMTQPVRELGVQLLALPTLAALFLCVVCLRWQLTEEHPFITFWNTVFQNHNALLYIPVSRPDGQQDVIPTDRLEDVAPLFSLAGQFHGRITLTRSLASTNGAGNILILIGAIPASADHSPTVDGDRLTIENSPAGRRIVDHAAENSAVERYGRAALLTIDNGAQHTIHIDGTDDSAIASLIRALSESSDFPDGLSDSFQDGTVTQIVFPMNPGAQAVTFQESLFVTHTAMNGPL